MMGAGGRFASRYGLALVLGALLWGGSARAQSPGVDRVLIEKAARRMTLFSAQDVPLRVYQGIQLGWQTTGAKHFAGDGRTPEGHYAIDRGLEDSAYHLALHVTYPGPGDRAFAQAHGRDPGGAIFIHGQPNGMADRPAGDWTAGCVAVSNSEIEEIWSLVGDDTPVDIVP
jgi:murein L,D-transpeptidase YafK